MRLVYKMTLTFVLPLVLTLGLWGWLSYHTMENKIHADTDLILKDYSDNIIMRMLSGKEDIEEALKTIDELLSDENKGNLTEEQQKAIEDQKSELEEMLENIEKAKESQ